MADNYLEKKMEELRRGPEKIYSGRKATQRKGYVQFAFPPKRVVIASEIYCRNSIARAFLKADCKVAMIHSFIEEGERMAHDEGVRYYPIPQYDECINNAESVSNTNNYEDAFQNLLSAWRDVDIVIADKNVADSIISLWKAHRERFPYVSSYICRLYIIGEANLKDLQEKAQGIKTTVNIIDCLAPKKDLSTTILTLSLPENDVINGIKIQ